ncbi:MAG: Holliday junction resolvase RuvX [Fibrobacterota bacterium]
MAVDFGERRIGIALSDPGRILATPWGTIDTRKHPDPAETIARLVRENDAGLIVVGYPLHLDGRISEKAMAVDAFIEKLKARVPGVPVERTDERYSSVEAQGVLMSKKRNKHRDKEAVDRIAAALFLQEYLDGLGPVNNA